MAKKIINKKGQTDRLLLGIIIIIFGSVGVLFWGYGIVNNLSNASWIGRLILGLISILVLIIERFLK